MTSNGPNGSEDAKPQRFDQALQDMLTKKRIQGETLEHVPDKLESNLQSLTNVKLLKCGYLLAIYKDSPKMLLAHCNRFVEVVALENSSKVLNVCQAWPKILSFHSNKELQVYDMATKKLKVYGQTAPLCDSAGLLLIHCKERDEIVGVGGGALLIWQMRVLKNPPTEIPLQSSQLGRVIHNAKQKFTTIIPETYNLQIGTADTVQVWDIERRTLLMQASPDNSKPTSFMIIQSFKDTVVTVSRSFVRLWVYDPTKYSEVTPMSIPHDDTTLTTSVALDESFLVLGDNRGAVALRERRTGELIYVVNNVLPQKDAPAMSPLISLSLNRKCNVIRRLGRYIVCGFENSYAAIYDMHVREAAAVQEYRHPHHGTVSEVEIQNGIIILGISRKATSGGVNASSGKRKPEIIVWSPKLAGFDFFFDAAGQSGSSSFTSLHYSYTRISSMLNDFAIQNPKEDVLEFTQTVERVQLTISELVQLKRLADVDVPFVLIKDLQASLDSYDVSLRKLKTSGKLRRFLDNNRLRREIEKWNARLAQCLQKVDFEVRKVKRQSGVRVKLKRQGSAVRSFGHRKPLPSTPNAPAGVIAAPKPATPNSNSNSNSNDSNGSYAILQPDDELDGAPPPPPTEGDAERLLQHQYLIQQQRMQQQQQQQQQLQQGASPLPPTPTKQQQLAVPHSPSAGHPPLQRTAAVQFPNHVPTNQASAYSSATNSDTGTLTNSALTSYSNDSARFDSYEHIPIYDRFGAIDQALQQEVANTLGSDDFANESGAPDDEEDEDDDEFGIIADAEGRAFWKELCGLRATMLDWDTFVRELQRVTGCAVNPKVLQNILDNSRTGFVSQYKFSEFLKGFGPLSKCIQNVNHLLSQVWFHGFLTSRESELLLQTAQKNTFLLRFSKSTTGSFALAYKARTSVQHIIIQSALPDGFKIREGKSIYRLFESLSDIIAHYSFVLKIAFASKITEQPWFQGDLNSAETEELLAGEAPGTFLVRFSAFKPGALALSFVLATGGVRHARIHNSATTGGEGQFFIEGEYVKAHFPSVSALVDYYIKQKVLVKPYQ